MLPVILYDLNYVSIYPALLYLKYNIELIAYNTGCPRINGCKIEYMNILKSEF